MQQSLTRINGCSSQVPARAEEQSRECREQEYKDRFGNCKACKQCDAGQELSKECGFGYGEGARCVALSEQSLQRGPEPAEVQTLPGLWPDQPLPERQLFQHQYYRKTKLSGFQDMECIPCGDAPPPYEPHCSGRVNLVPLPPVATSPRDVALAAVICSALATVLLALLVLCVIYCKRQLLEKKPSGEFLHIYDQPDLRSSSADVAGSVCYEETEGFISTLYEWTRPI
ncbi:hypothetical protein fugu_010972 [Takifugu bimaculatus]|uniref:TNFR-Cys domain-containing protein n=1 Tax=Takifugu bimaculatus TaxID=433685 RepID=A0A4Z2CBQ6_9TELE|nr:hypothetical protein fugu_010972 [Takifugu bimaculatus]